MKDSDGWDVRLCRRGEAWCGTIVDCQGRKLVCCREPAAVAYRVAFGNQWHYICAEHYGYERTDELRTRMGKE